MQGEPRTWASSGDDGADEAARRAHAERTDAELLRSWSDGDKVAGAELFDRHYPALHRFFANKAADAAEDLIQSVFLSCLEKPAQFAGRSSFRTYLLSVARFKLYRHYRLRGRRSMQEGRNNTTSAFCQAPSPSKAVQRAAEDRMLLSALSRIPIDLQTVLELAYWEDLSGPELAEVLGVPINTVYTRIHRAKRALRDALRMLESPTVESL